MSTLVTIIHVSACILLVIFVLLQSGKGAEISASFGGSSQTVFGSSGGANVFVKITGALAAIFFATSLGLTIMGGQARKSLFEASPFSAQQPAAQQTQAPPSGSAPAAPMGGTSQGTTPSAPAGQNPAPSK